MELVCEQIKSLSPPCSGSFPLTFTVSEAICLPTATLTVKRLAEIINETKACSAFVRRGNGLGLILIRSIRDCSRHCHHTRNCHASRTRSVTNGEGTLPVRDAALEHYQQRGNSSCPRCGSGTLPTAREHFLSEMRLWNTTNSEGTLPVRDAALEHYQQRGNTSCPRRGSGTLPTARELFLSETRLWNTTNSEGTLPVRDAALEHYITRPDSNSGRNKPVAHCRRICNQGGHLTDCTKWPTHMSVVM
jgi:hypothetical protein